MRIHGAGNADKSGPEIPNFDERIAAVFSSSAGEMGSALARRDSGEPGDDMAQNFAWQFGRELSEPVD